MKDNDDYALSDVPLWILDGSYIICMCTHVLCMCVCMLA